MLAQINPQMNQPTRHATVLEFRPARQGRPTRQQASPALLVYAFVLMLIVVLCSLTVDSLRHERRETRLDHMATQTIHVAPGDTLWGLAEAAGAEQSIPTVEVVAWIRTRNDLSSSALRVGQALEVPVGISSE